MQKYLTSNNKMVFYFTIYRYNFSYDPDPDPPKREKTESGSAWKWYGIGDPLNLLQETSNPIINTRNSQAITI